MAEHKRIEWIDGIKGLSCVFILIHHYFLINFPASYYGKARKSLCNGVDVFFSQSVLSFFMTGNFYVYLYILITGYVLTFQIFKMQCEWDRFIPFTVKRYLKLAFPLLVFCLLRWLENFVPNISVPEGNTFFNAIKCGVFKILLWGNSGNFGNHFWMLNIIFIGGVAVSLFAIASCAFPTRKMIIMSLFVIFLLLSQGTRVSFLYASCFTGSLLFFLLKEIDGIEIKYKTVIFSVALLVAVFAGAYPTGVVPDNYYRFLILPVRADLSASFWHLIGAFLLFMSISQLKFMRIFFEMRVIQMMARYSYSFYIFHMVVIKFVNHFFNKLSQLWGLENMAFSLIGLFASILASLAVAYVFDSFIVVKFNRKINVIYSKSSTLESQK